jgi:hypothetical protein
VKAARGGFRPLTLWVQPAPSRSELVLSNVLSYAVVRAQLHIQTSSCGAFSFLWLSRESSIRRRERRCCATRLGIAPTGGPAGEEEDSMRPGSLPPRAHRFEDIPGPEPLFDAHRWSGIRCGLEFYGDDAISHSGARRECEDGYAPLPHRRGQIARVLLFQSFEDRGDMTCCHLAERWPRMCARSYVFVACNGAPPRGEPLSSRETAQLHVAPSGGARTRSGTASGILKVRVKMPELRHAAAHGLGAARRARTRPPSASAIKAVVPGSGTAKPVTEASLT